MKLVGKLVKRTGHFLYKSKQLLTRTEVVHLIQVLQFYKVWPAGNIKY